MSNLLICTVGLPRSGKTTWARKQGAPIVSPDAIRLASFGQRFWAPGERRVWSDAHQMVRTLFITGHERVIVDATNITRERRAQWIADDADPSVGWRMVYRYFDVAPTVCKRRAEETGQADLIPIIDKMAAKFEPLGDDEPQLGATGEFPDGVMNDDDEGALSMAIGIENNNVVVQFGKPTAWLGLDKGTAMSLAGMIAARAESLP